MDVVVQQVSLVAVPVTLSEAKDFVARHHRHHPAPVGGMFAIGCADPLMPDEQLGEGLAGVVIVGRPVARGLQDDWTCEVTRLCIIPGHPNAASFLYSRAWRAAKAMGYRKLVTYTLVTEPGTSLRAAGLKDVARVKGRSWHTPSRPRVDRTPLQDKIRWELSA